MQPFAPLGRNLDHRGQKCSYSPGDTNTTDCPADAVWHILWSVELDNGFACDPHMAVARERFVFVDSHRVGPDCGMPGRVWHYTQKRCLHPDEPSTRRAAVALLEPAVGARQDETPDAQTQPATPMTAHLTTLCDACNHTLNWHSSGEIGCTVLRCACARYYYAAGQGQDGNQP